MKKSTTAWNGGVAARVLGALLGCLLLAAAEFFESFCSP
jgi:hypothetical protein